MNIEICYCSKCIDYLRAQGYKIWVGGLAYEYDEAEEINRTCDWCDEINELFEVHF